MNDDKANFDSWYADVLERLFPNREAGFPILMISFPLLERLLRNRSNLLPEHSLNEIFYAELLRVLPELQSNVMAKNFWQTYRNGLLHQVSISKQNIKAEVLPIGWLSHDKPGISIDEAGSFWVHPVDFAQKVLSEIDTDFDTFALKPEKLPLPEKFKTFTDTLITNSKHSFYLGTRTRD